MTSPLPPDPEAVPAGAEPAGFVVEVAPGDRVHFLDWGGRPDGPGVLLVHGLANTAWAWSPVARRLIRHRRVVAMDLRGHGLSDAPTTGYDPDGFAGDAIAVAEGSGILATGDDRIVLAGHGFGATVAVWTARQLAGRCVGVVLVDGGWERTESSTGLDVDEFLRTLEEPPEVMQSMTTFLADRAAFDPASWDADQERAARATVVQTHAGKVVPTTRPHVREATVRTMYAFDPLAELPAVEAPVLALVAATEEPAARARALTEASAARVAAGRGQIVTRTFGDAGHNLMRYRPDDVTAAILSVTTERD